MNRWLDTSVRTSVAKEIPRIMNPQFREQYAERGRTLSVMGYSVADMDQEDLYALIGYLLELSADRSPEILLAQEAPLGAPAGKSPSGIDPPKNDGLVEG